MIQIIGMVAGICTSISFFPQAMRILKTKRTEELSLVTYIIYVCGISMWIIYGVLRQDIAVWLTNVVSFFPACLILWLKIKEKKIK